MKLGLRSLCIAAWCGLFFASAAQADSTAPVSAAPVPPLAFDWSKFPSPVFDKEPGYVELYWKACELASEHVLTQPGMPQSPYMDEAFSIGRIWIWDTCFMSLYCRYAREALPGIESLSNFYEPIHGNIPLNVVDGPDHKGPSKVLIHHPDNPPLFAWVEWQYFQMSGDRQRVKWLLEEKRFLQKHYEWFRHLRRGEKFPWSQVPVGLRPQEAGGFQWTGVASGMDNSPRFDRDDVLAIDALAQQGLAAKCIAQLARAIGDDSLAAEYQQEHERIRVLVNERYWDETDGYYYDLLPDGKTFSRVRTPASFWPILAGMASPNQVSKMADHVRNKDDLGGVVPWVTVSRSDPSFNAKTGDYWRGAVWLPTAYMGIRALTEIGQIDLANQTAEALLKHMYLTFRDYTPHTIWECYNPLSPEPAFHGKKRVRPDFCGWSALGPISLFIENVLGVHAVDAVNKVVEWRIHQTGKHGIRNFRFGSVTTDFVTDGLGKLDITSNEDYTLVANGRKISVRAGTHTYAIQPSSP